MSQENPGVSHFLLDSETAAIGPGGAGGTLGASIRALREARGWGIADVSARLKFAVRQIEALESDRWEDLPQGPSLRGLVRNYARLLDIAPETLMQALPEHLQQHVPASAASLAPVGVMPHGTLPRWSGEARRRRSWPTVLLVLFLICALALAAYLVFAWWLPRNAENAASSEPVGYPLAVNRESLTMPSPFAPEPAAAPTPSASPAPSSPAVPGMASTGESATLAAADAPLMEGAFANPETGTVPAGSTPAGSTAAAQLGPDSLAAPADPAAPTPLVANHQLAFTVTAASWVEVRDASGAVVLSSTLQPGAGPQIEVTPPARVVIGNTQGISLSWQGAAVDLGPHQRGNVARLTLE